MSLACSRPRGVGKFGVGAGHRKEEGSTAPDWKVEAGSAAAAAVVVVVAGAAGLSCI